LCKDVLPSKAAIDLKYGHIEIGVTDTHLNIINSHMKYQQLPLIHTTIGQFLAATIFMAGGVSLANTVRPTSDSHRHSLMWIVSPLILSPNLTPLSDRPFQADNLLLSPELIKSCAGMLIILSLIFLKDGITSSKNIVSQYLHPDRQD
jgi:hypothetical protein